MLFLHYVIILVLRLTAKSDFLTFACAIMLANTFNKIQDNQLKEKK